MSVHITPCFRCPLREGCEQREIFRVRARAAGSLARSIVFNCSKLQAALKPGTRIEIGVPVVRDYDSYGEVSMGIAVVPATITAGRPDGRFACVIDPGIMDADWVKEGLDVNKLRFRRIQRHFRIRAFRDEPPLTICGAGNVLRDGTCDTMDGCACKSFPDLRETWT